MGKLTKRYSWKARQQKDTVVETASESMIHLDKESFDDRGYDESNQLVLPSKKRKTKSSVPEERIVKKLSKKRRKILEKVVQQKEKKTKRASLLESLAEVQASADEMRLLTGIADVQSGRTKRKSEVGYSKQGHFKVSTLSGSNKQKKQKVEETNEESDGPSSVHTSDMSSDDDADNDNNNKEEEKCKDNENMIEEQHDLSGSKENTSTEKSDTSDLHSNNKDIDAIMYEKSASEHKDSPVDCKKSVWKPAVHIPVHRKTDVQESRLALPILGEEQGVMEAISENPVVVICGETGSGKTTQVPQFLYEAGYAHGGQIIGITEPRRVAAVSMSQRVGMEMNLSSREVSYQIRYEGNTTNETKIKFMTDGVLLKEVQQDFLLNKYSVILLDEAHERSVYTDILIGLLSRIVPLRNKRGNPLKLVIMSATLRVEDFTQNSRLFKEPPPVVKIDSRQFPVTVHFNKKTPTDDYLNEVHRKVCKIHQQLPEGGILIFVTGQQEVHTLCKRLRNDFPRNHDTGRMEHDDNINRSDKQVQMKKMKKSKRRQKNELSTPNLPQINLDDYSSAPLADDDEQMERIEDQESDVDDIQSGVNAQSHAAMELRRTSQPLYLLPLYSLLPADKQAKVFGPVPDGCRLCVIATNVAETSLTIPNIKYVVDSGKVKTKFYDKVTGVSTFRVTWTSKASANQRAGRAGRISPGHCYRLYSSAVFNDIFEKFSTPEITRRPVDDLILQMKDMNIDKVMNFPFPTSPDVCQIQAAEKLLVSLGALVLPEQPKSSSSSTAASSNAKREPVSKITPLGRAMACFPVSPRYGKMLALAHQHNLLAYVIVMVSALSVQELFQEIDKPAETEQEKTELLQSHRQIMNIRRTWARAGESLLLGDLMVLLKAVGACEYEGCSQAFCESYRIRYKAIKEVRKLRVQLTNAVNLVIPDANLCIDPKMSPPDEIQAKLLRQIVLAGLADHIAKRNPDPPPEADSETKKQKHSYQCLELDERVFIHPSSVLYKQRPEFILYQQIHETSRLFMKGLTVVEAEWLPVFCPSSCTLSKPLDEPLPRYDVRKQEVVCHRTSTFGRCRWTVPAVELEYPTSLDKFRWFARFLLEGRVVPSLKKFTPILLSPPSTMIKSWAKLQPRTETLLKALVAENVDSQQKLHDMWRKDNKYLLKAISSWLPESSQTELSLMWPPT